MTARRGFDRSTFTGRWRISYLTSCRCSGMAARFGAYVSRYGIDNARPRRLHLFKAAEVSSGLRAWPCRFFGTTRNPLHLLFNDCS